MASRLRSGRSAGCLCEKVDGDFTEWPLHLTYWFRKYSHGIYIAMDRETNNAFLNYLSGDADFSSIPTVAMTAEHYCLPAFYTQNDRIFLFGNGFPDTPYLSGGLDKQRYAER